MPVWPFRRGGKKPAQIKEDARPTVVAGGTRPAAPASPLPGSDALRKTSTRRSARRKRTNSRSTASMRDAQRTSPSPVLRPANPPFAAHTTFTQSSAEDITALPLSKRLEQSPHLRPVTQDHAIPYNFHSNSHSSLPAARDRGKLQRPPSLQKRPAHDSALVRRKSTKKRKNDNVREEEIRAMSMPLPQKRPAGNSGGMLRRDSKKVKGGLNRHFERPTSNISLPLEDSIHSSMSGGSDTRAFRVSALDMFSPRPKIRYSVGSQYYNSPSGPSPTLHREKSDSRREHRTTLGKAEKDYSRNSRIDELADTLDAGALREILERDQRRREKKRKAEEERLRRRLERRAEKQRATEQGGTPATPRREATGAVGLGIERDVATPMEDIRPSTPQYVQRMETDPVTPKVEENSQLPTPLESPVEEPVVADARAVRYSRASMPSPTPGGHARGPSNISQMPDLLSEIAARDEPVQSVESPAAHDPNASGSLHPVETTDTAATSKKAAGRRRSSEGRRIGVFASLFRRGKRNSQDQGARTTPSEVSFSNTSRESMSRLPPPAHLVAQPPIQSIQIRRPSSVPHRTGSKFREDLPEFPLSPPDSRVQSPEVPARGVASARHRSQPAQGLESSSSEPGRTDSPVSPGVPPTGLMSQSLASVDSEGSWLSGKPMKRVSNKSHVRNSVGSSTTARRHDDFNASYEELGIPDDEYFRRLTPQPDERRRSAHSGDLINRKPSSTAMAVMDTAADSEDEEPPRNRTASEEENLVQSSVGRQPTIVHRQARVKSTEALVGYLATDNPSPDEQPRASGEESIEQDSPTSEGEPVSLQRATSVDLGKHHVRHLSAGSAKLLDIPAKQSPGDTKRSSLNSRGSLAE